MAILDIIIAPDPMLKKIAEPVKAVNSDIKKLMDDMLATMYDAPGVGLAAPQVGVSKRVIVIDVAKRIDESKTEGEPLFLINPKIISTSESLCVDEEGCLSAPDQFANVERPCEVEIEFLDYNGDSQTLKADGLLAVCIQHEIDHLDGIMFYEHASKLRKNIILRKLNKIKN